MTKTQVLVRYQKKANATNATEEGKTMAKPSNAKTVASNVTIMVGDKEKVFSSTWDVAAWEDKWGKHLARVKHPVSGRDLWIETNGEQYRPKKDGSIGKAYKRFPLSPESLDGKEKEGGNGSNGNGTKRTGRTVTFSPEALEIYRRYKKVYGIWEDKGDESAEPVETVDAAISALVTEHLSATVEALEKIYKRATRKARTLTPTEELVRSFEDLIAKGIKLPPDLAAQLEAARVTAALEREGKAK